MIFFTMSLIITWQSLSMSSHQGSLQYNHRDAINSLHCWVIYCCKISSDQYFFCWSTQLINLWSSFFTAALISCSSSFCQADHNHEYIILSIKFLSASSSYQSAHHCLVNLLITAAQDAICQHVFCWEYIPYCYRCITPISSSLCH